MEIDGNVLGEEWMSEILGLGLEGKWNEMEKYIGLCDCIRASCQNILTIY